MRKAGFVSTKKQPELPGMPKRDALGEAAISYLSEKDALDTQKEVVERAKNDLVLAFLNAGRDRITIEGRIISVSNREAVKISVKDAA